PRTGPPGCPRRAAGGSARSLSACPAAPRRHKRTLPPARRPASGTASSLSSRARRLSAAGDDGFVGPALALVVDPAYGHFLAGLAPFEPEMHERVLRYRGSPLRREHRFPGVGHRD